MCREGGWAYITLDDLEMRRLAQQKLAADRDRRNGLYCLAGLLAHKNFNLCKG